jgi:subtilase family serine protease
MLGSRYFSGLYFAGLVICLQVDNLVKFATVNVPNGWKTVGSPSKDLKLRFTVFLKAVSKSYVIRDSSNLVKANPKALEEESYKISTPGDSKYGQFLSYEEMVSLTRASDSAISTVVEWLNLTGATDIETSNAKDRIHFITTADQADSMMNTEFLEYRQINTELVKVRTTRIELPRDVAPFVRTIHPTTYFDGDKIPIIQLFRAEAGQANANTPPDQCSGAIGSIAPVNLAIRYAMPLQRDDRKPDSSKTGKFGIVGFNNYFPRYQDLQAFKKANSLPLSAFYGQISINGKSVQATNQLIILMSERW